MTVVPAIAKWEGIGCTIAVRSPGRSARIMPFMPAPRPMTPRQLPPGGLRISCPGATRCLSPGHSTPAGRAMPRIKSLVSQESDHRVNQRRAPEAERFGGRPWQSLGVFTITGDTLRVVLSANATNGSVAADAVRIVARTQPLPDLQVLNLTDNPLDNDAHQFFGPILRAHQKFTFDFDDNPRAPRWDTLCSSGQPWRDDFFAAHRCCHGSG